MAPYKIPIKTNVSSKEKNTQALSKKKQENATSDLSNLPGKISIIETSIEESKLSERPSESPLNVTNNVQLISSKVKEKTRQKRKPPTIKKSEKFKKEKSPSTTSKKNKKKIISNVYAQNPISENITNKPHEARNKSNDKNIKVWNNNRNSLINPWSQTFRDITLSQPPQKTSQKKHLLWLQERRQVGVWVQCGFSYCNKWRYQYQVYDPLDVPNDWYCYMNTDVQANSCDKKESIQSPLKEEDLIHALYTAGSLVWARLDGYPWWPGIVDDCPDTEQFYWLNGFSDIPTYYNITFFDAASVTRSWIASHQIKPYAKMGIKTPFNQENVPKKYEVRLKIALKQANKAIKLGILERLKKYSFVTRYKGHINFPKKGKSKMPVLKSKPCISELTENQSKKTKVVQSDEPIEKKIKKIISTDKSTLSIQNNNIDLETLDSNTEIQHLVTISDDTPTQSSSYINLSLIEDELGFTRSLKSNSKCEELTDEESFLILDNSIEIFQGTRVAEDDDLEVIESSQEFQNCACRDAVVPSTQLNLNEYNFDNSPSMLDTSLDSEMF